VNVNYCNIYKEDRKIDTEVNGPLCFLNFCSGVI